MFRILVLMLLLFTSCNSPLHANERTIDLSFRAKADDDAANLIRRSKNIVVARVHTLAVRQGALEYHADILIALKGTMGGKIVLRLPRDELDRSQALKRFDSPTGYSPAAEHASADFWTGRSGRAFDLMMTGIERGDNVIFIDEPHHRYGVEPVFGLNDSWVVAVQAMIANPKLNGSPVGPIGFLDMFPTIYLAKCGQPKPLEFPLGKVRGEDYRGQASVVPLLLDDYPSGFYGLGDPKVGPCSKRRGESFHYLTLHTEPHDSFPIAVTVEDGVIRFLERYGNLALKSRSVPLSAVFDESRQLNGSPSKGAELGLE